MSADPAAAFHDVQHAVDALPATGGTIRILPGTYRGQVAIGKPHVTLIGAGDAPEAVTLIDGASNATSGSIYASATVHVAADDFHAENLSFVNDWDRDPAHGASQAVALAVSGDRATFARVRIVGGQDTLYLAHRPGAVARQYFRDCRVEGHVDFIFGNGRSYFDRCTIHGVDHETVMYTAQARNSADEDSGFVFAHCRFTAGTVPNGIFIGRPWRPYATVVLIDTAIEAPLAPRGWREWKPGRSDDSATVTYAEYGTRPAGRVDDPHSRLRHLTAEQAQAWSLDAFFHGDSGWTGAP